MHGSPTGRMRRRFETMPAGAASARPDGDPEDGGLDVVEVLWGGAPISTNSRHENQKAKSDSVTRSAGRPRAARGRPSWWGRLVHYPRRTRPKRSYEGHAAPIALGREMAPIRAKDAALKLGSHSQICRW